MTKPAFLTMSPEQINEFRASKEIQTVMEWMSLERERTRELMVMETIRGNHAQTAIQAGSVVAFDHILKALSTPYAVSEIID